MLDRVEARFALTPQRLIGDTACGAAPMLAWLVEEKTIEPHVPVCDNTVRKDGTFSISDSLRDAQANEYRCPADKRVRSRRRNVRKSRTGITKANTTIY